MNVPVPNTLPGNMAAALPAGCSLKCEFSLGESLGTVILWVLLTLVTFGIYLFIAPYSFFRIILNKTYIIDRNGAKAGRLRCEYSTSSAVGHIIIWLLLTIITFGIGLIFYQFRVAKVCLEATSVELY